MTRKDYELIAKAINETDKNGTVYLLGHLVEVLCVALAEDNPRFDAGRFREACDVS